MLERAGVRITYRPKPQAGHDTSWWPEESPAVDAFAAQHPRDPLPDRLSWSTERGKRYARFRWLVIESLGAGHSESPLEDPNTIERTPPRDFGLRIDSSRGGDPRQVVEVIEGSNAQAMGLRKGDEIQAIDGAAIHTLDDILRAFGGRPESRPVVFEVLRHGGTQRMEGTVPPLPPSVREPAFPRRHDFGRVDLERQGNRIEARTRGVAAFTLLLSPERIDFAQPLVVVVNGRTVFEGRVEKDVATLVRWAARDDDRTMLFGAELRIAVP
jgi:membrane-associated protease RseP (regulator of RpoE activity)